MPNNIANNLVAWVIQLTPFAMAIPSLYLGLASPDSFERWANIIMAVVFGVGGLFVNFWLTKSKVRNMDEDTRSKKLDNDEREIALTERRKSIK